MPAPQARVHIAFASRPDARMPIWVDVTPYVLAIEGITTTRGRPDELAAVEVGQMSLVLDNSSLPEDPVAPAAGRFSRNNPGSPWYPYVLPFRRIQYGLTADEGATWSWRFHGYVDDFPTEFVNPTATDVRTRLVCRDRLVRFGKRRLRHPLAEELGTSIAVTGSRVG